MGVELDGECQWRQGEADEVLTLKALHCACDQEHAAWWRTIRSRTEQIRLTQGTVSGPCGQKQQKNICNSSVWRSGEIASWWLSAAQLISPSPSMSAN